MNKYKLEPSNYEKLTNIKMICDHPLTKREIKEPFFNKSFFYIISAPPGSGKTTLLFQMLSTKGKNKIYYRVFKNILYVCPPSSRGSIKDNPLADLDTIYDELSPIVMEKIKDNKKSYDEANKDYCQLLIIDDCSAFLKDNENMKLLSELSKNRRHLSLSIILLVQYIYDIPRSVRNQLSALIIFKPANNNDLEVLRKEFINMKKDDFIELVNFVFENKHDHLFINKENNSLYKNLQKIILSD